MGERRARVGGGGGQLETLCREDTSDWSADIKQSLTCAVVYGKHTALEKQDLSCTYLAHRKLEIIFCIITIIIFVVVVIITIINIILYKSHTYIYI